MTGPSTGPADRGLDLHRIRMLHTAAWAVFAGAILAIPPAALAGELRMAIWLSALVWVEVAILAANRMRCPLTGIAARYTDDRRANFDIYLPLWLARRNKLIFGLLFAAGQLVLVARWLA